MGVRFLYKIANSLKFFSIYYDFEPLEAIKIQIQLFSFGNF